MWNQWDAILFSDVIIIIFDLEYLGFKRFLALETFKLIDYHLLKVICFIFIFLFLFLFFYFLILEDNESTLAFLFPLGISQVAH
jgi:hypothetical protein